MPARTYAGTDTYTFTRRLTYVQNACWHTYVHVRTPTHVRTSAHIRTPEYIRTSAHVRTAARLCAGSPSWLCPSAGALAASEEYCWVSVLSGRCPPLQCRPGQPADCHHHHTLLLPSAIDCTALRRRRRTKPTSKRAGHCRPLSMGHFKGGPPESLINLQPPSPAHHPHRGGAAAAVDAIETT